LFYNIKNKRTRSAIYIAIAKNGEVVTGLKMR